MNTQEVADRLVGLCREGKFHEAMEELYSADIVSVEAMAPEGQSREMKGLDAVRGKAAWWTENHEVHSILVEGPLVAGAHFACTFKLDVTFKPANRRHPMHEIALYKVVDGKVVYEEFFYSV